jgi:UDP:flavonoid glycosyltransferase YjiC (YdhE family)
MYSPSTEIEADMGSTHLVFLSRPDSDHLYPTLALAEELGARGYQVTFATGDPYVEDSAGPGVTVLRFGRYERSLFTKPAFTDRVAATPPSAVVSDPRTVGAATEFGREWDVPVVVAHTNLAANAAGWPAEQGFGEDYVFVSPGVRGTVHDPWQPAGRRPVLLVSFSSLDVASAGESVGLLARAFGDTDWQLVMNEPVRLAMLEQADVLLTDGRLDTVSTALRAGVPLLLAPRTAEQRQHAKQLVDLGVGQEVRLDGHAGQLHRAVERLSVDEPTLATARHVRTLVQAAGAPATAADEIESRLWDREALAA